jgi:hypothetical protein
MVLANGAGIPDPGQGGFSSPFVWYEGRLTMQTKTEQQTNRQTSGHADQAHSNSEELVAEMKGYADTLVQQVKQMRKENGLTNNQPIAIYLMATPLVRDLLKQHNEYVKQAANALDIVQMDNDAGQPLPETYPHKEIHLGDDPVVVAINEVS